MNQSRQLPEVPYKPMKVCDRYCFTGKPCANVTTTVEELQDCRFSYRTCGNGCSNYKFPWIWIVVISCVGAAILFVLAVHLIRWCIKAYRTRRNQNPNAANANTNANPNPNPNVIANPNPKPYPTLDANANSNHFPGPLHIHASNFSIHSFQKY